ncbi:hypothetical protein PR048_023452 [Dryococelus australis]|uniref:Uncharacterized protein n=1 Tax=Dryococelus australis TaxID=614101 RepID=A0ABQ9GU69_9NEOP|nr:hypothetical protein PR048_023452 [Dryococelus australis]
MHSGVNNERWRRACAATAKPGQAALTKCWYVTAPPLSGGQFRGCDRPAVIFVFPSHPHPVHHPRHAYSIGPPPRYTRNTPPSDRDTWFGSHREAASTAARASRPSTAWDIHFSAYLQLEGVNIASLHSQQLREESHERKICFVQLLYVCKRPHALTIWVPFNNRQCQLELCASWIPSSGALRLVNTELRISAPRVYRVQGLCASWIPRLGALRLVDTEIRGSAPRGYRINAQEFSISCRRRSAIVDRLAYSFLTKANWAQSPAVSLLDFCYLFISRLYCGLAEFAACGYCESVNSPVGGVKGGEGLFHFIILSERPHTCPLLLYKYRHLYPLLPLALHRCTTPRRYIYAVKTKSILAGDTHSTLATTEFYKRGGGKLKLLPAVQDQQTLCCKVSGVALPTAMAQSEADLRWKAMSGECVGIKRQDGPDLCRSNRHLAGYCSYRELQRHTPAECRNSAVNREPFAACCKQLDTKPVTRASSNQSENSYPHAKDIATPSDLCVPGSSLCRYGFRQVMVVEDANVSSVAVLGRTARVCRRERKLQKKVPNNFLLAFHTEVKRLTLVAIGLLQGIHWLSQRYTFREHAYITNNHRGAGGLNV